MTRIPGRPPTPPAEEGEPVSAGRAQREAGCLLDWLQPAPGALLGLATDCACHPQALAARGFPARRLEAEPWLTRATAGPAFPEFGVALDGLLFLDRTLWPYWEVEEIHRLRLRRAAEALRSGGRLIFGERETLGRSEREFARRLAAAPAVTTEARETRPPSPRRGRFTHYAPAQAHTLLAQCGFELERVRNSYVEAPLYQSDEPGMIFVCRRV